MADDLIISRGVACLWWIFNWIWCESGNLEVGKYALVYKVYTLHQELSLTQW